MTAAKGSNTTPVSSPALLVAAQPTRARTGAAAAAGCERAAATLQGVRRCWSRMHRVYRQHAGCRDARERGPSARADRRRRRRRKPSPVDVRLQAPCALHWRLWGLQACCSSRPGSARAGPTFAAGLGNAIDSASPASCMVEVTDAITCLQRRLEGWQRRPWPCFSVANGAALAEFQWPAGAFPVPASERNRCFVCVARSTSARASNSRAQPFSDLWVKLF